MVLACSQATDPPTHLDVWVRHDHLVHLLQPRLKQAVKGGERDGAGSQASLLTAQETSACMCGEPRKIITRSPVLQPTAGIVATFRTAVAKK
jgi:hypothetical protein